jgi:hypothetical protein
MASALSVVSTTHSTRHENEGPTVIHAVETAMVKPHQEIGSNQMRLNKIKQYLAMFAFSLLAGAIVLAMIKVITGPAEAKITIGVSAIDGYGEEAQAAMDIWNSFVGCKFLVPGDNTIIKSDDGEPCGDAMRPEEEWGHAATAYACPGGTFEILISQPGNVNTQAAIIAHELGHRLKEWGVEHSTIGVMGKLKDPADDEYYYLRIRDKDVKAIKEHFCE